MPRKTWVRSIRELCENRGFNEAAARCRGKLQKHAPNRGAGERLQ